MKEFTTQHFGKPLAKEKLITKRDFSKIQVKRNLQIKIFDLHIKTGISTHFKCALTGKDAVIKTLKKKNGPDFIIKNITLLSTGEKLEFERSDTKLTVKANSRFSDNYPICFKIEIE